MKKIGILLLASTFALSACGKRTEDAVTSLTGYDANGEPTTPGIGAALSQEYTVRVISSLPSLKTGGLETAEITAAVTDVNNLPVAGVDIQFSADGGVLQGAEAVTNENGEATAVLSLKYDSANQDITIRAIADNYVGVARVVATGSTLEITGDDNVVLGSDVVIDAKLTAGSGDAIANEVVTISSAAGNTLSTTSGLTDPAGVVQVIVGSANGNDTLTFTALRDGANLPTVTQKYNITVSDDQLKFATDAATELSVNEIHSFVVNWSYNGQPIIGEALNFSITAGQIVGSSSIVTDSAGQAKIDVLSSIAGEVTLQAEAADGSVNNKHTFEFVGVTPAAIGVISTSTRVKTRDSATIIARVQDANLNPVKNTLVQFSSANLKGGQLSTTTAQTNAAGDAEVTFTAGNAATNLDEIQIFAEVIGTNISNSVALTVVEPVLNVTIGSSNMVEVINNDTQYSIPYVVQVADGAGQPLEDAKVYLSVEPIEYVKGYMVLVDSAGYRSSEITPPDVFVADQWSQTYSTAVVCASEDVNGNRILDPGEDTNNNGSLDPQDPALIMAVPDADTLGLSTLDSSGIISTSSTGSGHFNVVYPTTNASWAEVRIVARVQGLGVEAEDTFETYLRSLATEIGTVNSVPVNSHSPYGLSLSCTNTD